MNRRTVPRVLTRIAIVTMVVSAIGFIASLLLNAYVFDDKYDDYGAYGEAQMPNSSVRLPAGNVTVYWHTDGSGSELRIPGLHFQFRVPKGDEVPMSEDRGNPATDDNGAHVRIGHLNVPVDGTYEINAVGDTSGYKQSKLTFGHPSSYRILPLAFAVTFGLAVLTLIVARVWAARVRPAPVIGQQPPPAANVASAPPRSPGNYVSPQQAAPTVPNVPTQQTAPTVPNVPTQQAAPTVPTQPPAPTQQAESSTPSGEDVRQRTLKTLAELRDSGALTEEEYEAEKNRVLEGR